jgi:tripartite-type tricarboxylate transporter receptor subunit TctC
MLTRLHRLIFVAAILGVAIPAALAQNYPAKPIRFIVGPGPDVVARIMGQRLTESWSQQVVVDQRPGAGGVIAADTVAKAVPDGYTILLTTGAYTINAVLYQNLPFNLERDFAPVTLLVTISFVIVVNPTVPAKTLQEFIALAKAKPGTLNCGHSGPGTTAHLGCEILKRSAGINIVSVPYKGTVPALVDTMTGQSQIMFAVMQGGLPYVQSGKLRAIAVTGAKRQAALPDVQTVREAGVPGADIFSWNGVHAPAKTPAAVISKLNAEMVRIVKLPEVQERMHSLGLDPVGDTPQEFAKFVKEDIARWAKAVKETGVKAE